MIDHLESLNPGPPTEPRPAASVILLRRGGRHSSAGLEVLFVKRTPKARFMPNVWVFPGGAVDRTAPPREAEEADYRVTALRELEEEVAIELGDPGELVPFSRWITPVEVKVRFDTRFYLALAPPHASPRPDQDEIVDTSWLAPAVALERHAAGAFLLVFPTIKQLEALLEYATPEEAMTAALSIDVEPILPRVVTDDGEPRVLLPGDAGYQ
jgi:8-oxo-dGTP pyrophosphatase MutT (NUDIX family)